MSAARTALTLTALPLAALIGAGAAGATPAGQPGIAAPNPAQPALTPAPAPAPSPVDVVPDANQVIPTPTRPRPSYQQPATPHIQPAGDTTTDGTDDTGADTAPASPADLALWQQGKFRVGDAVYDAPPGTDPEILRKGQGYIDMAEWQTAAMYDQMGFSPAESDRRAASTVGGALVAGGPAALVGAVGGALIGGTIGGVAGAAVGTVVDLSFIPIPGLPIITSGVAGTAIGAAAGAAVGAAVTGVPAAVAGGVIGNALSTGDHGGPMPAAPEPLLAQTPVADPIAAVSDTAAAIGDQINTQVQAAGAQVNATLSGALAAMPPMPAGPLADLVAGAQTALAGQPA